MFHSTAEGACPARTPIAAFIQTVRFLSIFHIMIDHPSSNPQFVTILLRRPFLFHIFAATFPHPQPPFPHLASLWKTIYAPAFPPGVFHKNAFFNAKSSSFLWEILWKLWENSVHPDACLHKPILYPIVENPPDVEKRPNGANADHTALFRLYEQVSKKDPMSYLVHFPFDSAYVDGGDNRRDQR